eukprot:GSChrysophyteH1.ASY1.ANO1.1000.1 assembled CDS
MLRLILLVVAVAQLCAGFYLPGVAVKSFGVGEEVELKVNKLSSVSVHTQLPFDYYSLKFCQPKDGIKPYSENLGEFLRGDRIENSAYEISMLKDEYCRGNVEYIYNHANIILEYHPVEEDSYRIVGFYVEPLSVAHSFASGGWDGKSEPVPSLESCARKLVFTYGVEWRESEVRWASRWDVYLSMNHAVPDKVHWFSIVNSLLIVMFLAFMVAMILVRTLTKEINRYNRLVHADVFRPPATYPMLFCVLIGTGMQLFFCSGFVIVFAALGFISPANRGSLMIGLLLLFVLMGSVGGFMSARLYKSFKGKQWQRATLFTALLFPGIAFLVFFSLNLVICVPLVFLGAYFGYKKDSIEYPVVTSNIPRQIPEQPWYLHNGLTALLGGILPFGACFVDLCAEDYRWWWKSLLTSGNESTMMVTYALYFGYMAVISFAVFLVTGAIGFFSCLYFNYMIYRSVRVD